MGNAIKTIGEALESVFGDNPNGTAERSPTITRDVPVRFSTLERASSPVQSNTAGYSTTSSTNTSQGSRVGYTATNHSSGISTTSPTNYWTGNSSANAAGYSNASRYSTGHMNGYSTATSSSSKTGYSHAHPVVTPSRFPNAYSTAYPTSGTSASSSGQRITTTPSSTAGNSNVTSPGDSTGRISVYPQRVNSTEYSTGYTRQVPLVYPVTTGTAYATPRQTVNSTQTQQPAERSWPTAYVYTTDHARTTATDYDSSDEDTEDAYDDSEEEYEDKIEEENLVAFYHYTDYAGMCAIKFSGFIKESTEDTMYAQHGRGVYGTNMAPCEGKLAICINNWNNGGYARMRRGRADYAVCLQIPESKVKDCSTRRRDLLLHEGRVFLSDYEYEIVCVDDD